MEQVWALVKGGTVDNVIVADQQFIDSTADSALYETAIEVTDLDPRPGPGWAYDEQAGFTQPPPAPAPAPSEEA